MKMKIVKCVAVTVCVAAASAPTVSGQELNRVKELMTQLQAEVRRDPEPVGVPDQVRTESAGQSIFPADATDPERLSSAAAREKVPVRSGCTIDELEPIDTLPSANEAVSIVLYNDNTWRYVRNKEQVKDSEIYTRFWDTTAVLPYREIALSSFPSSIVIDLVDSLQAYHYPYKGAIHPRGTFGPRRRRPHRGIDLPLKTGDPIYATFNGRVRISQYNRGGYGNLVVIRHDNGLETYYVGRGGPDHRQGRLYGPFDGAASPFRDPLLRADLRSAASDRFPDGRPAPRDDRAEAQLFRYPLQCGPGFRR